MIWKRCVRSHKVEYFRPQAERLWIQRQAWSGVHALNAKLYQENGIFFSLTVPSDCQ